MNARSFDARRLDVAAFAEQQGELAGELPLAQFQRLTDFAAPEVPPGPGDLVRWQAQGESRAVRGRSTAPQAWLHLQVDTALSMTCQRCLQPLAVTLSVVRDLRFVEGEEAAAAEDAESEDDVLALTPNLNLHTLMEDELVLALPWVPRHEACPEPLVAPVTPEEAALQAEPHPFQAALARVKKRLDS
jgi:uncharacterized protein